MISMESRCRSCGEERIPSLLLPLALLCATSRPIHQCVLRSRRDAQGWIRRKGHSASHSQDSPGQGWCLEVLEAQFGAAFLHLEQAPQGMVTLPRLPGVRELWGHVSGMGLLGWTPSLLVLPRKDCHGWPGVTLALRSAKLG